MAKQKVGNQKKKKMQKNNKNLTPDEFNSLVSELDSLNIKYDIQRFSCSVKLETANCIFNSSLTGDENDIMNIGAIANKFYKSCNMNEFDLKGQYGYKEIYDYNTGKTQISWDFTIAHGYQYYDEEFNRKWLKCWSYDINSAFPYAMLCPMPDTRQKPRYNSAVGKREIGFYKLSGGATIEEGAIADIVFPLMDSPFKTYVYKVFMNKKNSKDNKEKDKWKSYLNFPTGLLARKNIFFMVCFIIYFSCFLSNDTPIISTIGTVTSSTSSSG